MACSVCYLAKSFILHQISVGITATRGHGFVLTTKQNKKIWFLLFWLAWKICRIWTTFVRSVNQAWGCQILSWPTYWDANVKTLACQMPRPQNTLRTWQGWRLLPDLPFVVGPLHLFFFLTIFGTLTFAVGRNFTNFPLCPLRVATLVGLLVLLFALSKHILLREIAQSLPASTPSHGWKQHVFWQNLLTGSVFFFFF